MRFKKIGNLLDGDVIACLQTTFRRMEHLAYLTIFHIIEITELEHGTLHIRQSRDSLLKHRLSLIPVKIGVCHQRVGEHHILV